MKSFLKGIAIGLGAIAPGLSGSVLLVIFGLYQRTINAISTLFSDFKRNFKFLFPLALGIGVGIILFSKIVDFFLDTYSMQTRFAFFGCILGTIPLFFREVRKKGFSKKFYAVICLAFALGMLVFNFNKNLFPDITDPNPLQSVLLGVAVAASYIVPGIDSAAILSSLGMYELWVKSLADFRLEVLIFAACGAAVGVLGISFVINKLIKKCYTATFSVIFGLFLSVIPSVLDDSCVVGLNLKTLLSVIAFAIGLAASIAFGQLSKKYVKE